MMKYRLCLGLILLTFTCWGQNKYEKEYRIAQSEFPTNAYELIAEQLASSKRIRFYKETDSLKNSFEAKFKKGKLHYSVEFDEQGILEDIEIIIKEKDIPEESWDNINEYLQNKFSKVRIVKIQQQYPVNGTSEKELIHHAFQNLILPYINYELVFAAKVEKGFQTYEALFNAKGEFIKLRKSLSSSYDHVLY
ncbi:hypothetical protein LV716_09715 [Flagellimonas sp. HMM57]|uniref:hypothetical protein n=1 Tax=unclassified Flagellimonas TaxID=2644544 RepID=UPI0013CFD394|nr:MULTISPECIES: hypothetical protein [unclassified Flagellimonas]UII74544.1 hypothetical protein LV716_09715 [Flagellimonas sp. HMM57]